MDWALDDTSGMDDLVVSEVYPLCKNASHSKMIGEQRICQREKKEKHVTKVDCSFVQGAFKEVSDCID